MSKYKGVLAKGFFTNTTGMMITKCIVVSNQANETACEGLHKAQCLSCLAGSQPVELLLMLDLLAQQATRATGCLLDTLGIRQQIIMVISLKKS